MKDFYFFLLYLLFTATCIVAKPLGCFGTETDDLRQCKSKIAKKAAKEADVMTLSPIDHKKFVSITKSRLGETKEAARQSLSFRDPVSAIPQMRSAAYSQHNLKVLEQVKPGGRIAISKSNSLNNRVYHPVKEGKLKRIMNVFSINSYALPMLNQEKSSNYELLTQDQILAHKANELALASAATQSHENHVLRQKKPLHFHPMQSHHEKGRKKATTSFQTHLNNLDQLNMVERTDGAVKITKSSNGKKDIYTAITKDHYHQHKHEPSSSTSDT